MDSKHVIVNMKNNLCFLSNGIVRGLSEYVRIVEEIHFTHIRRRMLRIKPSTGNDNDNDNDNEEPITLVVDASGLTVDLYF
jgi:hypothetical protein